MYVCAPHVYLVLVEVIRHVRYPAPKVADSREPSCGPCAEAASTLQAPSSLEP